MRSTRQHNQINQQYTLDEYLQVLAGESADVDPVLRHACELVWDLPPDPIMPSSLDVTQMLSELGCDNTTLTVSLLATSRLFDSYSHQRMREEFGEHISSMVDNVCRLHSFQNLDTADTPEQAERLRRMLMSLVEDVRVMLIKLAFRVQRMRQIVKADDEIRRPLAQESMDVFAPIANRLGIGQLKWELEDLSFRCLKPDTYKQIANYIDEKREEREGYIQGILTTIDEALQRADIKADTYGRPKHIYSIWRKMTKKKRSYGELFDVRAVRVVVDSVADCYIVLGLIHGLWPHIPREFDDYIANPKDNGYQSLHTAVHGPEGKPVEVQIRTREMHEFAEHGVAAHWRYKEGTRADVNMQKTIDSIRALLDPAQTEDDELLENFHANLFHDRVYVLTPDGRVIDLPRGATPIDFAYAVHTEVGHRCRGAKVNGSIVQLTYALQNGEMIEVLTGKEPAPSRDWVIPHLGFIKTSRARNRIKAWFRKLDREQHETDGKLIYEQELRKQGVRPAIDGMLRHFKQDNESDLYVRLGRGDISHSQLLAALHEYDKDERQVRIPSVPVRRRVQRETSSSAVNVLGVGNLMTTMANCCKPVPGDDIVGYITMGKGVSIHRTDCKNVLNLPETREARLIDVEWGDTDVETYPVQLIIEAVDRHGLLSDITQTVANEKLNVIAVSTLSDKKHQTAKMSVTVEIGDLQQLGRIMDKIGQLRNVINVMRASTPREPEPQKV